ncbi:GntR family transcriptional regulator [Actinomadura sp. KC216]|uniref:GntR family transcriptional regulator n=1 Tax=Actinomadura sp. KC216 TaxID=2530370 RepID=UPI0010452D23|nr:GntR family transcriptional regulator [Actinomadura sp. KC216]TDB83567.1 GntR family transcriptional regulator [Actinomadura sp. KC216]
MADREDERLPSRRVARLLRAEIEEGTRYPPGGKLPSYRRLAERYEVATNTAAAAVQLLAREGLVTIRAASGAYVRSPSEAEPDMRGELAKIRAQLNRSRSELDDAEKALVYLLSRIPSTESDG